MASKRLRNLPSRSEPPSKVANVSSKEILKSLENERAEVAKSIINFKFNKSRVKMLSKELELPENSNGIVYWMSRDQRVQDNWAFLFAQRLAIKQELPLHVIFCLVPKFLDATYRHYDFMLQGLQEVETECLKLNIPFHLLLGQAKDVLPEFVKENNIGGVITDFSPLRLPLKWVKDVEMALPSYVPFSQVDAHNIIPCWITSDKQEYAARTIRTKIHAKLKEFLTNFPPVILHPHSSTTKYKVVNWTKAYENLEVDKSVGAVVWAKPGFKAGIEMLHDFCSQRLKFFSDKRNNPNENALSNLSPWIHFGQISVQRCILEVKKYKHKYPNSVDAYIEECIVRRELSDNFCYYQKDYDNLKGAHDWAKKTLEIHRGDKRTYIYSRKTFDEAKTHDDLWNSAQIQLVKEGKMHGFLRMYWAKKILEWTKSPEEALSIAIYLNDRYNLDGRDPNGYVGCMWSICGVHDTAWTERNIFGKIRFMNYQGCKRKFNIKAFIAKYGGKEYKYEPSTK